jgi:hypothetical protein
VHTYSHRLIPPAAKLGRIFYHTAMCLLAQTDPLNHHHDDHHLRSSSSSSINLSSCCGSCSENRASQLHHARHVCGIVAHLHYNHSSYSHHLHARPGNGGSSGGGGGVSVSIGIGGGSDRSVLPAALQSLAVAGAALADRRERAEVLCMLARVRGGTGWGAVGGLVEGGLRAAWGWEQAVVEAEEAEAEVVEDGKRMGIGMGMGRAVLAPLAVGAGGGGWQGEQGEKEKEGEGGARGRGRAARGWG